MEPSQVYGVTEECHSSESGWTMYLESPSYGDDQNENSFNDGGDDDDGNDHKGKGYTREDDSDDSMASDASSGPSHQGTANLKHKGDGLDLVSEEASKPMEKRRVGDATRRRRKDEKNKKQENVVLMADQGGNNTGNALSAHQSGSIKVRKSFLSGKRI